MSCQYFEYVVLKVISQKNLTQTFIRKALDEVRKSTYINLCTFNYSNTDPQSLFFYSSSSGDRKSTRLNSSHVAISYAVFCVKKKTAEGGQAGTSDGGRGSALG